ncbi:FMN-binding protein, partial [uncultured Bifidobacterium sp.]|uniref:FMN-binding protein n=1 Tax=uncultured Bifidobacterium sp. TaxID=165187 RepID=UPI00262A86DE
LGLDVAALVFIPQMRIQQSRALLAQATTATTASSGSGASASSGSSSSSSSSSSGDSASSSSTGLQDGTYTGSITTTGRGDVQVRITVSGGSITAVDALQYPQENPTSSSINDQAIPIYVKEALAAQSSEIQLVSGATETYDGFTGSLQDAILQAKG